MGAFFLTENLPPPRYGLYDEAKRVAEQIQFKPAMQDGAAVDHTTSFTCSFRLASPDPLVV